MEPRTLPIDAAVRLEVPEEEGGRRRDITYISNNPPFASKYLKEETINNLLTPLKQPINVLAHVALGAVDVFLKLADDDGAC